MGAALAATRACPPEGGRVKRTRPGRRIFLHVEWSLRKLLSKFLRINLRLDGGVVASAFDGVLVYQRV